MTVKITPNDRGNPPGKLADAELHFAESDLGNLSFLKLGRSATEQARIEDIWREAHPLAGLKLIGFGVWQSRAGALTVTFPARSYTVNSERRSFALLRPIEDPTTQNGIRDAIIAAYQAHVDEDRESATAYQDGLAARR